MKKKEYIESVRKHLASERYANRLAEELEHHIEDSAHAMGEGQETAESEATICAIERLGSPETVSTAYNELLTGHTLRLALETIFTAALFTPILLVGLLFSTPLIDVTQWLIRFIIFTLVFLCICTPLVLHLQKYTSTKKQLYAALVPHIAAPACIVFIWFWVMSAEYGFPADQESRTALLYSTLMILWSVILLTGILRWAVTHRDRASKKIQTTTQRSFINGIVTGTKHAVAALIAIYLLIAPVLAYSIPQQSIPWSPVATRIGFDYLVNLIWTIVSSRVTEVVSYWAFGFVFVILAFVSLYGIIRFFQKSNPDRKFPWVRIWVAIYAISALFLFPLYNLKLDWFVPVQPITDRYEKTSMGPFYHFTKYMNAGEGRAFHYEIDKDENNFIIVQNNERRLYVSNITAVDRYDLTSQRKTSDYAAVEMKMPDRFTCKDNNRTDAADVAITDSLNTCDLVLFKNKPIFSTQPGEITPTILDIEVTPDGQFALIHLTRDFYNPNSVYLVDLRGL